MPRVLAIRAVLFILPFVIYFIWREAARRGGRPMGSTPWAWLVAAGAALAAASLIGTVIFRGGPDNGTYVPAEARADGSVAPGRFVAAKPAIAPTPPSPTRP